MSVRTHDLLTFTIERFVEFCMVYLLYVLVTFWGCITSIASMADPDALDSSWIDVGMLYLLGYDGEYLPLFPLFQKGLACNFVARDSVVSSSHTFAACPCCRPLQ